MQRRNRVQRMLIPCHMFAYDHSRRAKPGTFLVTWPRQHCVEQVLREHSSAPGTIGSFETFTIYTVTVCELAGRATVWQKGTGSEGTGCPRTAPKLVRTEPTDCCLLQTAQHTYPLAELSIGASVCIFHHLSARFTPRGCGGIIKDKNRRKQKIAPFQNAGAKTVCVCVCWACPGLGGQARKAVWHLHVHY